MSAPAQADVSLRERLGRLMAARLGVALGVLGLALAVVGAGHGGALDAERGLYGTFACAFAATVVFALALSRVVRVHRLAAAQIATDIALVTALVTFSGGSESMFGFLYLPIVVYGALFFGRGGAYGAAALSAAGHALALGLPGLLAPGVVLRVGPSPPLETTLALAGVQAGALLLVALLSSALARELRLAGERLDARTSDLERLRRLHERTVESLTSGLMTLDATGRVTSFNPEAERITGLAAETARGALLDEVLPGATELLAGEHGIGKTGRRRLVFRANGGAERYLGLAASTLRDSDGEALGRVVIFQDVTEVVEMERDLQRSVRLAGVGQLAADIAHEIRNPLAAISGSVEMLRGGGAAADGAPEQRRLMDIVLREIDRLDALITDFLQYARPAPPKRERVAVDAMIREIAEMCQPALPAGIALEVEVPHGLWARVDATQLRQALWNLVANAQQALGEAGVIRLAAHTGVGPQGAGNAGRSGGGEASPGVEILVSDDGCGIASENLERIFDPFFTTKAGGTGLGLPTVHRIVEGNGGRLQVESRAGAGSIFRLWLPQSEEEA